MLTLMTADLRAAPSGLLDGGPKGGRGRQRRLWVERRGGGAGAGGTVDQIGNIGNFMYYNRPLSASEVLQNYSAIRGRYGI